MNIFIVIAAYNEEKKIGKVIDKLKENHYKNIVVVDDGSKDKTSRVAKEKQVHILKHIINRGQGAALQTGISYALRNNADIIVTFDADDQHDPTEIESITKPIKEGRFDAALGSRFLKTNNTPLLRKIMLKGAILVILVMYRIRLTDAHNGFRALSRDAASKIIITHDGMEHASEIVEEIKHKNISFTEVPVTIKYSKETLQKGQSGLNSIKILMKMVLKKMGA